MSLDDEFGWAAKSTWKEESTPALLVVLRRTGLLDTLACSPSAILDSR